MGGEGIFFLWWNCIRIIEVGHLERRGRWGRLFYFSSLPVFFAGGGRYRREDDRIRWRRSRRDFFR